jgi:hypothetical protein
MTDQPPTPTASSITASGALIDLLTPDPAMVDVRDIAHSLARLCRWNGHVRAPILSVAQHSVMVSEVVPPALALAGLLHDAAEAYLGDVIGPLKPLFPAFVDLERRWALVIGERFGLGTQLADLAPEVVEADARMLATERRDMVAPNKRFTLVAVPYDFKIGYMGLEYAEDAFLARFNRLYDGR